MAPKAGGLDVWLGTFDQGTTCEATLEVRGNLRPPPHGSYVTSR
jgi:hypothetical protein